MPDYPTSPTPDVNRITELQLTDLQIWEVCNKFETPMAKKLFEKGSFTKIEQEYMNTKFKNVPDLPEVESFKVDDPEMLRCSWDN